MAQQAQVPAVPQTAPKSIQIQYFVTVLQPNATEFSVSLLCKNYTEAKKVYKEQIKEAEASDMISLIMTINRISIKETRTADLVVARTVKLK